MNLNMNSPGPGAQQGDVTKVNLVIQSFDRDRLKDPSPSSYWIQLPYDLMEVRSISLLNAQIPFHATHLVGESDTRRTIPILVNDTPSLAKLPVGTYDSLSDLVGFVAQALNEALPMANFTVDLLQPQSVLKISSDLPFVLNWGAAAARFWNSARIMGFSLGQEYKGRVESNGRYVIQAPFRANLEKPDKIIVLKIIPDADVLQSPSQHIHDAFALLREDESVIKHPHLVQKQWSIPISRMSRMHVQLCNLYDGEEIDFQNAEHILEFIITTSKQRTLM